MVKFKLHLSVAFILGVVVIAPVIARPVNNGQSNPPTGSADLQEETPAGLSGLSLQIWKARKENKGELPTLPKPKPPDEIKSVFLCIHSMIIFDIVTNIRNTGRRCRLSLMILVKPEMVQLSCLQEENHHQKDPLSS